MDNHNKKIKNLSKKEGSYQLKIENMCVDMVYSNNNKSFNECMLNILKLKNNIVTKEGEERK